MTLPQLFRDRVARYGARTARLSKVNGAWKETSWQDWGKAVDDLARGLIARRLQPGDSVAILSQSRAEWTDMDLAIMSAGGVSIPIYPSSTPEQVEYILRNSEARMVLCEDQEQLRKVVEARDRVPMLRLAVVLRCDDTLRDAGLHSTPDGPFVITTDELVEQGWQIARSEVDDRIAQGKPSSVATIVYTSGTTGPPKGVVQSHENHFCAVQNLASLGLLDESDRNLLFLPLAHSFARAESFGQLYVGYTTAYAESVDRLVQNLGEVKPTILFSVPRIYEKAFGAIQAKASESPIKRALFGWAVSVGRRVSELRQRQEPIPVLLALQSALAHKVFFSRIQQVFGGRIRCCVSGGAPLARSIAELFHAAGVLILEGYGLTETCPVLTVNRPNAFKFGTVGQPIPGVEVKLGPDGEILGRGPNVALGYYKRDEDTKAVFLDGGWFATGDIGEIDEDGFIRITDRKKDLIKTSGGKYVAPQEIENRLKAIPFVAQCMVHGDRRKFCSVVIVPSRDPLVAWAKERGLATEDYERLVASPEVTRLFDEHIGKVNESLASYEQPKRFILAAQEWTSESGELTPTLKVKRKVVTERFQAQLDALYDS